MPVVLAPAADLGALAGVLLLIGLLSVTAYTFTRLASVLNFSILGIHPLANVANAIENTIVAGCNAGVNALQEVAKALWNGLVWMWHQFLDGLDDLVSNLPTVLSTLYRVSVPALIQIAVAVIAKAVRAVEAKVETLGRTVATDINRLDAKIENTARATLNTAERDFDQALKRAEAGIEGDIRAIRSSVDQAIDHALQLARSESQAALGELRRAEDAALGALRGAQDSTAGELQDLIRQLDPTKVTAIIASVPLLAALINTIAQEAGLDRAECRAKVKQICATDPAGWGNLLAGVGALGFALSLRELVPIGQEMVRGLTAIVREAA